MRSMLARGEPNEKQMAILFQKLLAERFAFRFHHEQRDLSVYAITVAKGGPKMTVSAPGQGNEDSFGFGKLGNLTVGNMTMASFARWMQSSVTDRPIVDHTGLTDHYDFKLKWTPDDSQFAQFRSTGSTVVKRTGPNAPPPLEVAMPEQIGLDIRAVKAKDDVIVVEHAEQPSPN